MWGHPDHPVGANRGRLRQKRTGPPGEKNIHETLHIRGALRCSRGEAVVPRLLPTCRGACFESQMEEDGDPALTASSVLAL